MIFVLNIVNLRLHHSTSVALCSTGILSEIIPIEHFRWKCALSRVWSAVRTLVEPPVHFWYTRGILWVHSRYTLGAPTVHFGCQRCAWTGFRIFWTRTPASSGRIRIQVFLTRTGS